jgi:hypothetical protein
MAELSIERSGHSKSYYYLVDHNVIINGDQSKPRFKRIGPLHKDELLNLAAEILNVVTKGERS